MQISHLHARSAYSLLKGSMSVETLVLTAKNLNYQTVALTDLNVMHGVPEFLRLCQRHQLKAIIGLETQFQLNGHSAFYTVIAKNIEGFKTLLKFSSLVNSNQSLDLSLLKDENNLICIIHNLGGVFEEAIYNQSEDQILSIADLVKENVKHPFFGLSYQEDAYWQKENSHLSTLLKSFDIPSIAFPKVYYAKAEDVELNTTLIGIEKGINFEQAEALVEKYRYFLDQDEMLALYDQESLDNVSQLVDSIESFELPSSTYLPKFDCPQGLNSKQYLTQLCLAGLNKRLEDKRTDVNAYKVRLKHELDVIFSMNYEDYFLIVYDFIRFAKTQGIYVGPGRGSAAGSLVSYSLGITHVDPLEYGLLFERFLNPERISMPDIDTDFPDNRRDEVLSYVLNKYGQQHVAHIATFGTLAAKQVIRDVGKVLDFNQYDLNALSKAIPSLPKITLEKAYEQSKTFAQLIQSQAKYQKLYQLALKLEGLPRHVSTHAAGIVMSSVDLNEVVPLIQIEQDMLSTQYTMEHLESLGLIKMDFLGLRNLTIIDDVVQAIKDKVEDDFNILKIDLKDQKTIELVRRVDTVGIFQLESEGMKKLLERMHVGAFEDIVATIALFRPGPMENIPSYLAARANPQKIHYLHPDLKPILESTSGILIYQEQIMQVAQVMAGFSLAKADVMRKAMSKKNLEGLENLKKDFIAGCLSQGYDQKLATDLFELILKFANYGFNKSHSVAYGLIAYQMAYLKANFPLEFYIALLNSVMGSETKSFEYISEARNHGLSILSPSINASFSQSVEENGAIRLPLLLIKGLGSVAVTAILNERDLGIYKSFYDFIVRISMHKVNRKNIEALIDAGALDQFNPSRNSLKASLDDAFNYADMVKKPGQQTTIDLELVKPLPMIEVKDVYLERLEKERAVLGFYLSDHPILQIKQKLGVKTNRSNTQISQQMQTLVLMVKKIKTHRTKKGDMMAFVVGYDESGDMDVVIMPNLYQRILNDLKNQSILKIDGIIEKEGSILARKIEIIKFD